MAAARREKLPRKRRDAAASSRSGRCDDKNVSSFVDSSVRNGLSATGQSAPRTRRRVETPSSEGKEQFAFQATAAARLEA
jgi:hypothetical protein